MGRAWVGRKALVPAKQRYDNRTESAMMAASPLPVYIVYVMSIYIRKHFEDCTSNSFPENRAGSKQ